MDNEITESYITMPAGFKAAGVACGLKTDLGNSGPMDLLDLNMVESDVPATVAGVYTKNLIKGHSLQRTIRVIDAGAKIRALVVNSKNANACVGPKGYQDAVAIAEAAAKELGCSPDEVLTASTGTIGIRLDTSKVISAMPKLVSSLSTDAESAHMAEKAMMTTDTVPKEASAKLTLSGGKEITIAGMAKGSGMICPNLGTMIVVFTTDAAISKDLLQASLKRAVSHTFNRVSVDGDTSCCDMVVVMANGVSGASIAEDSDDLALFEEALTSLSLDLSRMIASDGEGASKFIEVICREAKTAEDAKLIVTAVAKSPLVKTAVFGEDANWGRIITAAGYSGADFDPEKVNIRLAGLLVCQNGQATDYSEDEVAELVKQHDIKIEIDLNQGAFEDRMFSCDFSYDYVKINGSYRT